MTVEYIEYKGKRYITRWVYLLNVEWYGQAENVQVADIELWSAIKDDYENGVYEAKEIDDAIYFYCDSGFIASEPTDDEIVAKLKESLA